MKNVVIIGVASLVLFGASAGVSVWLQSTLKPPDTAHGDDKKKKKEDDHGDKEKDKGHGDDKAKPADPKADPHAAEPKPKEANDYPMLKMAVVALDVSGQMQEYNRLVKETELVVKELAGKKAELDGKAEEIKKGEATLDKKAADLKKTRSEMDADERANVTKIAGMLDNMPAEAAAATIQQLADTGKTDLAVKIVAQMKPRMASKMLAAVTDTSLPPVLLDRIKAMKPPTTQE